MKTRVIHGDEIISINKDKKISEYIICANIFGTDIDESQNTEIKRFIELTRIKFESIYSSMKSDIYTKEEIVDILTDIFKQTFLYAVGSDYYDRIFKFCMSFIKISIANSIDKVKNNLHIEKMKETMSSYICGYIESFFQLGLDFNKDILMISVDITISLFYDIFF